MKTTAIIIDDERHSLETTSILINRHCPEVLIIGQAITPERGIELIDILKPGLVILDVSMPKMDGMALIQCLRFKNFSLIMTTASESFKACPWQGKEVACLFKPFSPNELIMAVKQAMEIRKTYVE
ncbi:MAG: response regulator [Bacteroidales bacterium]|nr:response regulator [Bacteroidales bacterium]